MSESNFPKKFKPPQATSPINEVYNSMMPQPHRTKGMLIEISQDYIGKDDIDVRYLTPCGDFSYQYHECLKDTMGDILSCKPFKKSLRRCEEVNGLFQASYAKLGVTKMKKEGFRKYSNVYKDLIKDKDDAKSKDVLLGTESQKLSFQTRLIEQVEQIRVKESVCIHKMQRHFYFQKHTQSSVLFNQCMNLTNKQYLCL
eukprot:TRINITY_DN5622_c0_g1_i2.p1 TRINITY_DN5622_c0_g1~~TRINITY_DN5622_c0_g1_i2.p1  ORF type:complete len:199 (+),score=6.33 TRINITY_DN5622_c0_g1_i2:131-727(+)